jgi:hypothetical protein
LLAWLFVTIELATGCHAPTQPGNSLEEEPHWLAQTPMALFEAKVAAIHRDGSAGDDGGAEAQHGAADGGKRWGGGK